MAGVGFLAAADQAGVRESSTGTQPEACRVSEWYGGIDLGATTLSVAIASADGTLQSRVDRATPTDSGEAVCRAVTEALDAAARDVDRSVSDLAAIGVGCIGPLDQDRGVIHDPPNLDGVSAIHLRAALEACTDGPVSLCNDAIAGLHAERAAGAPDNAVYLTISTGIGAGVAVDGHVLTGQYGNAAEVGHFIVAPNGDRRCGCGSIGHWEAYAAGAALPSLAEQFHQCEGVETDLAVDSLTTPALVDAAGADPLADRTLQRAAEANAIGLAGIIHAYDPERITVGGTLGRAAAPSLLEPAVEELPAHIVADGHPDIRVTTLDDPVLEGALVIARQAATSA